MSESADELFDRIRRDAEQRSNKLHALHMTNGLAGTLFVNAMLQRIKKGAECDDKAAIGYMVASIAGSVGCALEFDPNEDAEGFAEACADVFKKSLASMIRIKQGKPPLEGDG